MKLTGDCEVDCQKRCAYPGQFSECDIGAQIADAPSAAAKAVTGDQVAAPAPVTTTTT